MRIQRTVRSRLWMVIVPCLVPCLCPGQEAPTASRDYTAIVSRFAQTMREKGTDRYGQEHSPLFACALDLKTLSMPAEAPAIPPGPRIREGDRCWAGCNPYLDTETIRAFYELSRRTADPKYREAAQRYLSHFLKRCPSPATGLLPWGEHNFWNPTTDAVEGIYTHHVFDKATGLFNRHASYK